MVTRWQVPLHSAHQNRMDSLPPAAAPWRESLPWCSRRGSASPWRGPAGGAQNAGGSGKRPYKGTGRGGYDRPSPLEKGAVAAKGGDWGFLVSCRGHGERRRKKPSVTASPCHLPFQRRFLKRPRTDGAQRRGCRGIGQTLRSSTRSPSRRPNAESLRSPLHRSARWQVPRQAHFAGADGPDHRPSQAPVGREREQGPSSAARRS